MVGDRTVQDTVVQSAHSESCGEPDGTGHQTEWYTNPVVSCRRGSQADHVLSANGVCRPSYDRIDLRCDRCWQVYEPMLTVCFYVTLNGPTKRSLSQKQSLTVRGWITKTPSFDLISILHCNNDNKSITDITVKMFSVFCRILWLSVVTLFLL